MKISAWVFLTDLLPEKKTLFDKLILDKVSKKSIFRPGNTQHIFTSLQQAGVNGIELLLTSSTTAGDILAVQKILKQYSMPVLSIHQPLDLKTVLIMKLSDIEGLCEIAKSFSVNVIVLHLASVCDKIFDATFVKALHVLEEKYKITIGLENNPKQPLCIFKSYTWKGSAFAAVVAKKGFHITFDVTHLAQTGGDIIQFFKNNKDYIVNIHISDYKKHIMNQYLLLSTATHLPLHTGELPIKDFLQTLKKEKYNGLLTMEINSDLEGLCDSAKIIKNSIG